MSKALSYAYEAHLLKRQDYKEEAIEGFESCIELSQHCQELILYEISKDVNLTNKCKFVDDVEFTYRFIHPAIARTYKYTYLDHFSVSYIGDKNSFLSKELEKLKETKRQIILIGIASALKYLESKGVSHYCLDVNHIILDKLQLPKLVCSGIPFAFKPDDWDDNKSPIQSFGKIARTILSNQRNVPEAIQNIVDRCNNANDLPTFDDILDTLSKQFLENADEDSISNYIDWLVFQDKFPCDYYFDLNFVKRQEILKAAKDPDVKNDFADKLYKGDDGYPKDFFGALYFSGDDSDPPRTFLKYYGFPEWLQNLNSNIKKLYHELNDDHDKVEFNPNSEFHIDEKDRSKLVSTDVKDIKFVISSYLNGKNNFPKSEQAAFYHVKKLLKNEENNAFLLVELGKMYEIGIGTPVNYIKAKKCYEKASIIDKEANQYIERVQSKQEELEKQINEMPKECKEKLEKADSNNFRKIMYVAFSFLHELDGFPKSQFHAYNYYKKAAKIDPYVYCMLGNLFRHGIVFSQNMHKAAKFYTLSNLNGCLRGRFYDGFMQMSKYYPQKGVKKQLKFLDKFFFDYKNQQGKSNSYNYCKMIHASQQHFPVMISFSIDAESTYYKYRRYNKDDQRIQNNSTYIKQSIDSDITFDYEDDERMLDDTEIQISMWFTLYQLKLLLDNGLFMRDMEPDVRLFKDSNYFFSIMDSDSLYGDKSRTIQHLLYKQFKKSIPERIKITIKEQVKKNITIEENLDYFENNLVSNRVNKDKFESFIRKIKNFVPLDSAKILISEKIEKADSYDKDSLKECARNYFFGYDSFPINYCESFKYYRILAGDDFNDSNAQMWLGIMLSKGIGVKQDIQESINWFKKASDQGDVEARLNYSLFLEYYNRKIKHPDDPIIPYLGLLTKSAEANDPQSLFEMGKLKESHVSWEYGRTKSIKYYLAASQLGHIESTRRLYHVYKKLGMKKEQNSLLPFLRTINDPKYIYIYAKSYYYKHDYENSIKFTKMMLHTKDPKFRKLYGDHLLYGHGIEEDIETAKKFYIAASLKYPKALVALASIYEKGIGCKQDLLKARKIFFEAITVSRYSVEANYRKLYCDFCERHGYYRAAFNFQKNIAKDKKDKEYQFKVAMSYLNPVNKMWKKNINKGIDFLTMSADQHYPIAAYELGKSYIYGRYKQKRNFEKGVKYLKLASNLNYLEATVLLGKIYYQGIGTIPDEKLAYDYFLKAASKNDPCAKYYLSLNTYCDYFKRHQYLVESAEQGYSDAQFHYGVELINLAIDQDDEDYQKGKNYIEKAASQNNKKAKAYLDKNIATSSKRSENE